MSRVPAIPRGFDLDLARRQLQRADPALGRWMRRIGPLDIERRWSQRLDLVDALARSILYQQLSGKAAATIVGRLELCCGDSRLRAPTLATLDDAAIRGCGVSGNKLLALRDLCRRALAGELPTTAALSRMDDAEIIDRLSAVRGIGRWTVEMLLMFRLGRADVFAADDLGLRKGLARLQNLEQLPTPKLASELATRWAPWRTLASLYLWRIADAEA